LPHHAWKRLLCVGFALFPLSCRGDGERPKRETRGLGLQANIALAAAKRISKPAASTPCPSGMALVEGNYCPDVKLNCLRYLDPPGRYHEYRCAAYAPSTCLSKERVKLSFCIDRHEFTQKGNKLPENRKSFRDAAETCQMLGKRVCQESEYNFACEGEEMRPYPYGFKRDASACNADRKPVVTEAGKLLDLRAPSGSFQRCQSSFGVFDLAGNLEEFVAIDRTNPVRPAMKGSYWQPGRNFCRAAQTAHDEFYSGTETGFRCCSDVKAKP
jgi:hypothetical protein